MTGKVTQMTIEDFVESFVPEDAVLATARARADEVGIVPVTPAAGAALRLLAAAVQAKSVVEVGTGTGLSGLWLLRGMRPDGVLTSIDAEAEHQRLARASFSAEGVPNSRARLINGRALDVLPRLADRAYDIVFCSADRREYPDYLAQVVRLLRPGGILIFDGASRAADTTARDAESAAVRRLAEQVAEDTRLAPALLPVGTGLLAAAVLPEEA
jgi:predicted O-methyltransferase YrrM